MLDLSRTVLYPNEFKPGPMHENLLERGLRPYDGILIWHHKEGRTELHSLPAEDPGTIAGTGPLLVLLRGSLAGIFLKHCKSLIFVLARLDQKSKPSPVGQEPRHDPWACLSYQTRAQGVCPCPAGLSSGPDQGKGKWPCSCELCRAGMYKAPFVRLIRLFKSFFFA